MRRRIFSKIHYEGMHSFGRCRMSRGTFSESLNSDETVDGVLIY
ncbi:hypothetical protein [Novipirellula caenicola]